MTPRRFAHIATIAICAFFLLPTLAQAADATGGVAGTVRTDDGAPVAAAHVVVAGPQRAEAQTDASGAFAIANLSPGIYHVEVSKGSYLPADLSNVVVFSGETQTLAVTLSRANLNSLRTIASVHSYGGKSAINTTGAATALVTRQDFANLANPSINSVLQHVPGLTVQHLSSQPNTSLSLAGSQPYETQVLIDGHPFTMGRQGVWYSQYFNSFLVASAETQSGPGNTTPFANMAVGGTVNIVTPGFTNKPTAEFTIGRDSYASDYSNFLTTGTVGKLAYVFGLGYGSSNGPFYNSYHCEVTPDSTALNNKPGNVGIIQFCGDASGSLYSKGELLKFRYDFSPVTSFEVGFVGSQGGLYPQGAAYGNYLGTMTVDQCLPSAPTHCTNPKYQGLVGTTIDAYSWYPGSLVHYDQPIFTGQFRTSVGNDTLLIRPYAGSITNIVDGTGEADYPNYFFPTGSNTPCQYGGATSPSTNGYTQCNQTVYTTSEYDKLQGTTFSYLHPVGEDLFTLTYDYHSAYDVTYILPTTGYIVPPTTERFDTISLTGDVNVARNLTGKFGLYDTVWKLYGQTPAGTGPNPTALVGLTRSLSRFDPHVALVYRPKSDLALRAAFGTSETFPYQGLVSGTATIVKSGASLQNLNYLLAKNAYLDPEVQTAWDVGVDKRFHDGGLLSVDYQTGVIHNVFETVITPVSGNPNYSYLFVPANAARLKSQFLTLHFNKSPTVGIGYAANFALQSSILNGLPESFYSTSPSLPANGQQQCGISTPGGQICIPYMTGYGEINYTSAHGTFLALGTDFQGKNNTYAQPPFWQWNLTARQAVSKTIDIQFAVENLFNTNNFYSLPMPNLGVPVVGETTTGLGSISTSLVPAGPRTARLQLQWHLNR
jgi:hypothetical protein